MDKRQTLGKRGEDIACETLRNEGYIIAERRFRTRCGELDIIAWDGRVLVFVEVRARSTCNFGTPLESITWQKRQRLTAMAAAYVCARRLAGTACRFDVVSIVQQPTGDTVQWVKGAFDMEVLR